MIKVNSQMCFHALGQNEKFHSYVWWTVDSGHFVRATTRVKPTAHFLTILRNKF